MNRSQWTYISHKGEKSFVNIWHSPRLGHFAILLNKKIVLLDKKVFGQDSYSFFIDDELCIVEILLVDNQYQYRFRIDMTTKTELNDIRKKTHRKHIRYTLMTFGTFFGIIAIITASISIKQDNRLWTSVIDNAVLSVATVKILQPQNDRFYVTYAYRDSIYSVQGLLKTYSEPNPVLENGFPIQNNDEFLVTYSSKVKSNSKLHLNHPTHQTIQRYRALAFAKYSDNNPDATPEYCDCILNIAYKTKGWKGYALVYNATTPSKEHDAFNQKNYQNWLNSKTVLDEEINCWQYK